MYSGNPAECRYEPESPLTRRADTIAAEAHGAIGQKYGRSDYIAHPRMAAQLLKQAGYGEVVQAAGLLHDVIEDTDETPASLLAKLLDETEGMDEEESRLFIEDSIIVVRAVIALSEVPGDTWETKIGRARSNPFARVIKSRGDAQSHLDYNRWKVENKIRRPKSVERRVRKYTRTQKELAEQQLTPEELDQMLKYEKSRLGWTSMY